MDRKVFLVNRIVLILYQKTRKDTDVNIQKNTISCFIIKFWETIKFNWKRAGNPGQHTSHSF